MIPDAEIPNRFLAIEGRPRLLVSVRNVEESRAAIAGGCDILDVKEPARGSLGMADVETISSIAIDSARESAGLPLSVALGETTEWIDADAIPQLPRELAYVKLGTAGLADHSAGLREWIAIRKRFDSACQRELRWIAVGYADWQRARAPKPVEVFHAAMESSCAGLLIDTFVKDGRGLLDWMSVAELSKLSDAAHRAGLLFAVAGSLSIENLQAVQQCRPDVIAVRSAACDLGARRGPVTIAATRMLRDTIDRGVTEY